MQESRISGHIVDIHSRRIFDGEVVVREGTIAEIRPIEGPVPDQYILPGFIDAHIHIESSMMVPAEFARMAVRHGTVATVSDPHEIGNVLGIAGVEYMVDNGNKVPFHFYFGAPSCVPATSYETAGAEINIDGIRNLIARTEIKYLAEMMNWPGVLHRDEVVMEKIQAARQAGKPIDGHAPGLKGKEAFRYASAGISTDHECYSLPEALDKLAAGMKIIIREGSAARNFDTLIPLMDDYAPELMFCSDDKHPDELILGHINQLVSKAVQQGYDPYDVLRAACLNPVEHYDLDVGLLRPGDPADFIIVEDLDCFHVLSTFIHGDKVYDHGAVLFPRPVNRVINQFNSKPITKDMIRVNEAGDQMRIIIARDGQLITGSAMKKVKRNNSGDIVTDVEKDILKIVIVNRYQTVTPVVAFITGFGLQTGAIASTVAHDSHNIIVIGVDDDSMVRAVNRLITEKGGVCAINDTEEPCLPLPVAGLMSTEHGELVVEQYKRIDELAKKMGSKLRAPFMTLSFMALLVIPKLKLSDRGLFDGQRFQFVDLMISGHEDNEPEVR